MNSIQDSIGTQNKIIDRILLTFYEDSIQDATKIRYRIAYICVAEISGGILSEHIVLVISNIGFYTRCF